MRFPSDLRLPGLLLLIGCGLLGVQFGMLRYFESRRETAGQPQTAGRRLPEGWDRDLATGKTDLPGSAPGELSLLSAELAGGESEEMLQLNAPFAAEAAFPGPQNQQEQRQVLAIIAEELPEATPAEREIWLEKLKGMPPDEARFLLRMRKQDALGLRSGTAGLSFGDPEKPALR